MPAKSKDQQRAAAIALKAKREGKVDDLPAGAAKNMAKSMSEKELAKYAGTKHKGLPENKPNENRGWAGESLLEVFAEEMLDTDEDGESFTSDKNTRDQVDDAGRDKEDDTGWDAYDDSWDSKVNADAPMGQAGRPMGSNVTGAARVSYESKNPKLAADEKVCSDCRGSGLKNGHGDTQSWRETPAMCNTCKGKGKVKKKSVAEARYLVDPYDYEAMDSEEYENLVGPNEVEKQEALSDLTRMAAKLAKYHGTDDIVEMKELVQAAFGDLEPSRSFDVLLWEYGEDLPDDLLYDIASDVLEGHHRQAAQKIMDDNVRRAQKSSKNESKRVRDLNSLDILFEGPSNGEYYTSDEYYDLTHSSDDDWYETRYEEDERDVAQGEIDYQELARVESYVKDEVRSSLDWAKRNPDRGRFGKPESPSLELAIELADDEITDLTEDEQMVLVDAYENDVDARWHNEPTFFYKALDAAAKAIGTEIWEEWSQGLRPDRETESGGEWDQKTSDRPNSDTDIDEQAIGGLDSDWTDEDDWMLGDDVGLSDVSPAVPAVDPFASDINARLHSSLIDDMVDHIITHNDLHGKSPDEWLPEELLADFEYDYAVSPNNPDDVEAAKTAIARADEELESPEEVRFESKRWQKLAGMKLLKETTSKKVGKAAWKPTKQSLQELNSSQAQRYVKRMAKHKWQWLDVAKQLSDQYGMSLSDIERLKPVFEAESETLQQEAMLGGVSNGGPAPGHRAKVNEDSDLELLTQGKAHRVDIYNVRDELAGLAFEIAGEIQGMHLDSSDRKTEKMLQNKLENMYRHLLKLKNLAN